MLAIFLSHKLNLKEGYKMGLEKLNEYTTFKTEDDLRQTAHSYLENPQLNTSARLVLEYITACSIRYRGACTIYRETIATKINMTVTTVARALRTLRDLEMIAIIPAYRRNINGGRGASIYQVLPSGTQDDIQDDTQAPAPETPINPDIPTDSVQQKPSVSLFSNFFSTSSIKQLSRLTDSLIHEIYIDLNNKGTLNKALFLRVVEEVRAKENQIRIANPAAYLRAAICNAQKAMQEKYRNNKYSKSFKQTVLPEEVLNSPNQVIARQEVLPDWFDKEIPEKTLSQKEKAILDKKVEECRRKLGLVKTSF